MPGRTRAERAEAASSAFISMIEKVDPARALELIGQLQAAAADKRRGLEAEVAERDRRREINFKILAGDAALKLLVDGNTEEREWITARLERLLRERDAKEVLGATVWLRELWSRRGEGRDGTSVVQVADLLPTAEKPSVTPVEQARPAWDGRIMTEGSPMATKVLAVAFPTKPNPEICKRLKAVGLGWYTEDRAWRSRTGQPVILETAEIEEIRAAAGVITEVPEGQN